MVEAFSMKFIILATVAGYGPVLIMLLIAAALVGAMLLLSWLLGPGRRGRVKDMAYESGVDPVGTARKSFHTRFYLLAILFLLFDVELIFFYQEKVGTFNYK